MGFYDVLTDLINTSANTAHQGRRFERLIYDYLLTDPKYKDKIKRIWLWKDFPFKFEFGSGSDVGIDIVIETMDGEYWALQCKCYSPKTRILKQEIDSFMSTSSRTFIVCGVEKNFSLRIWVSTTTNWSANAEACFCNQIPKAIRITPYALAESGVDWGLLYKGVCGEIARPPICKLFDYQTKAVKRAIDYFNSHERAIISMACGSGKTIVALHIARLLAVTKRLILVCLPSISLLAQTLRVWINQSEYNSLNCICVCSDPKVSKDELEDGDYSIDRIADLAYPASTDSKEIFEQYIKCGCDKQTVIFTTYQSIDAIRVAQQLGLPDFDIIICDEAHRTTGIVENGKEDSARFVRVHNNEFIRGKLRLYMTATPKLYTTKLKKNAEFFSIPLYSMDDKEIYGEDIFDLSFKDAIELKRLTDYKVLILTINEEVIPQKEIKQILDDIHADDNATSDKQFQLEIDTLEKLVGCVNALAKNIYDDDSIVTEDPTPIKRALVFAQNIKTSKNISTAFNEITKRYRKNTEETLPLSVTCRHIDGRMRSSDRDKMINWLKSDDNDNSCKMLSNVRCLSEGIDVPSLDAIIFLAGKNSVIEVAQSIGRVVRIARNKKFGYVIIPVLVPNYISAEDVLDENKEFKIVWDVLNALRSHDSRLESIINKIRYNRRSNKIVIGSIKPLTTDGEDAYKQTAFKKLLENKNRELKKAIYARLVKFTGSRNFWLKWAGNVAEIAAGQISELNKLVKKEEYVEIFDDFLKALKHNLNNPNLTLSSVIEMLAQHKITEPVFNALFKNYLFASKNPISIELNAFLKKIPEINQLEQEERLKSFYDNIKLIVDEIDDAKGRQEIIIRLYNTFFKIAFPDMVQKLGIIYTPIELVDFIINSVDDILQNEFGRSITEEKINILDPFTGTGTFVTRLIQSDRIRADDLERKFTNEIFANEIVLLAYYIATINIESEFHEKTKNPEHTIFKGIVLTDTFELGENEQLKVFNNSENIDRLIKQKQAKITVIIGNPPYSVHGTVDEFLNKIKYSKLDGSLSRNYVKGSKSKNTKSLYDSYIRAFRWATDKIGNNDGIIAFVTNASWIKSSSCDMLRKSFEHEFSKIYIFNLRGDLRTAGEYSQKEGENIFWRGSRAPIAITILVKSKNHKKNALIYYCDIGDSLKRKEKLEIIKKASSFLSNTMPTMKRLTPSEDNDWLISKKTNYTSFYPLAPDKTSKYMPLSNSVFSIFTLGISTNRDSWTYSFGKSDLKEKMTLTIDYYNKCCGNHIDSPDPKYISLSRGLNKKIAKGVSERFDATKIQLANYRPFNRRFLYYSNTFVECTTLFASIFPKENIENLVIAVSGISSRNNFSCLISDKIVDFNCLETTRCFPLYYYKKNNQTNLISDKTAFDREDEFIRHDGISDSFFELAKSKYNQDITKEDIFYYIYGILHSREYKDAFLNELKSGLPKIPLMDSYMDFLTFSSAGRKLADLHLNFESLSKLDSVVVIGDTSKAIVSKMKYEKIAGKINKKTIIFNEDIRIENIPEKANEYIISGKSAIVHIMDQYQLKKDPVSEIVIDPNHLLDSSNDNLHMLNLLLSVITVRVKTIDIVEKLPKLKFNDNGF
ncbi:MAG: DEAD/DEAH box helicase family protein [Christensenellaceae bacterium]|jgi:predicted helicase|nr:DEAD/DEAH box helicase family protein [Christensenellaceae bacterium]